MVNSLGNKLSVKATSPPELSDKDWNILGVVGIVLFLMAILQLISFTDFKSWLEQVGFSQPAAWGVVLIMSEVWAGAGFFKIHLSPLFRIVSAILAFLVSGFWFIQNLRLVSGSSQPNLTNSGFFGNYLTQTPSWWTVLEVSLLLFGVIYALNLFKPYFDEHTSRLH